MTRRTPDAALAPDPAKRRRQWEMSTHFERLARALAETHEVEPPPKDGKELIDRMVAIDPRSGMGTKDPLGGDWDSHLSYLRNRELAIRANPALRDAPRPSNRKDDDLAR